MGLPSGDSVLDFRDRAIIKFFLYTGARIGTGCRLEFKTSTKTATRRPSRFTKRATSIDESGFILLRPRPSANTSRKPSSKGSPLPGPETLAV